MAEHISPKFTFASDALDIDTFHVVSFKGTEGISAMYQFEIMLISDKSDVELEDMLSAPATFTIKRDDGDIPFHGILNSFEQLQQAGRHSFYRASLVPKLWWLTLTHHNQIFLNENVKGFIGNVLEDGGLKQGLHFDFKLQGNYDPREYVCQYDESHFSFVSRWMERDGLYYYFEQSDQTEKMVVTDTYISHSPMPEGTALIYSQPSNLDHTHREEVIKNFMVKQQPMPKKVVLKDYNYRKPSLEMKAESLVSDKGMGEIYIYGDHFLTPDEGEKLANIRAEEFRCRSRVFHGVSTVPYIRTGYVFELKDHYRQDFNQRYMTTEVTHEGSQEAYLTTGLGLHLSKHEDRLYYRNSFNCIPATTQFRPERNTEKLKFHGSMNAKVDASGSGQYAELDSHGRYKVVLPLDMSGRNGGKATTWLRMAQPYGGSNHGMHFPLHKGTEVLLTCIDGDPDRPIIQAAVPNPETPSMVNDSSQTQCRITTGGQNRIHIEDMAGSERILLHSPKANSWLRMGTPNDPPDTPPASKKSDGSEKKSEGGEKKQEGEKVHNFGGDWEREKKDGNDGWKLSTDGEWEVFAGSEKAVILGHEFKFVGGTSENIIAGNDTKVFLILKEDFVAGLETGIKMGGQMEFAPLHTVIHGESKELKGEVTKIKGQMQQIIGDVDKLEGNNFKLVEEKSIVGQLMNSIIQEHNKLAGQTQKLAGSTQKLVGTVEDLHGEVNDVRGTTVRLCGEVSELAGEQNKVVSVYTKAIGETTKALGEESTVSGQTNAISGEINEITSLKCTI